MSVTFDVPKPGESLGHHIRGRRRAAGLSQSELARRSGIARPNLAAIESGARCPGPAMAERILIAIGGEEPERPNLHLSPAVLIDLEVSRVAAWKIVHDPTVSRQTMSKELRRLRSVTDGHSDRWLDFWDRLVARWDLGELIALLLSTEREDIDHRKVSPLPALLSNDERLEAVGRARELWRASR